MYKVVILILSLVCGVRVGKAVEALPETTVASSFQFPDMLPDKTACWY